MKWNKQIRIFVFIVSAASVGWAKAGLTPLQSIKELDAMADQYKVGKNLTAQDKVFNQQLKKDILRGTFDLRELAKIALDKYWSQRTKREQDRFVELLTQILEERSLFSKERAVEKGEGKSYLISYKSQKYLNKEQTDAYVHTVIRLPKKNLKVDLDYKLKKTDGAWKIYDVVFDGASLVDNYRYSFGNIIKKQGYDELVRRMENKLKEFRSKRSGAQS